MLTLFGSTDLITTIQKVIKTKGALALVPATTNIEDPDAPDAQPNLNSLTQKVSSYPPNSPFYFCLSPILPFFGFKCRK